MLGQDIASLQGLAFPLRESVKGLCGKEEEHGVLIPLRKIAELLAKQAGAVAHKGDEGEGEKSACQAPTVGQNQRGKTVKKPQAKKEPKGGRAVSQNHGLGVLAEQGYAFFVAHNASREVFGVRRIGDFPKALIRFAFIVPYLFKKIKGNRGKILKNFPLALEKNGQIDYN